MTSGKVVTSEKDKIALCPRRDFCRRPSDARSISNILYVTFSFEAGLSKDILLFLGSLFGLLLTLLGLFLDGLGYLLNDDLFDLLLELLCLTTLILNSFRHLLLDRFEHLGNDLLGHLVVDLLCDLDRFRFIRLLGDLGAYLCHRIHPLFQDLLRLDSSESLNQEGDDAGPAGLMAGSDACTGVAMEVLVEEDVVAPVLIVPPVVVAVGGPTPFLVADEQARQPSRYLLADLEEVQLTA